MPDLRLDAITPTLSHLLLSDGGLHTLRFRFALDRSVDNLMVLVGTLVTIHSLIMIMLIDRGF